MLGGLIEEKEEAFPWYQELLGSMWERQGRLSARLVVASPLGAVRVVWWGKRKKGESESTEQSWVKWHCWSNWLIVLKPFCCLVTQKDAAYRSYCVCVSVSVFLCVCVSVWWEKGEAVKSLTDHLLLIRFKVEEKWNTSVYDWLVIRPHCCSAGGTHSHSLRAQQC